MMMRPIKNFILKTSFLVLIMLVGFTQQTKAQTNVVPDDVELQVLKNIYDSLGVATWINKVNWPTPGNWPVSATATQMDAWYGITVTNGDITGFSLSSNNLTGQIPKTISRLIKLNGISFQGNQIAGTIPSSIGSLSNLNTLYLHGNKLTGSIPTSFNNLTGLLYLYLSTNLLTGDIPNLGSLINLRGLGIASNSFNAGPIPSWITNCTLLNVLDLSYTKRNGPIPSALGSMTSLTTLFLYNNQLTGSIPESIGNLTNLTQLMFNSNQLSGALPSSLGNLTKLTSLYLHTNYLTGSIPASLGNLSNLTILHVGSNQLSGSIPTEIGNLTKLTGLYLNTNQLSGTIPSSLGNLINLTQLYLYSNQLSGDLPSSLGNLTKLQYFYSHGNQFSGSLPSSLSNWSQIYLFYINGNKFSGQLPDNFFATWTKLGLLSIGGNNFNGPFPSSISSSTLLSYFQAGYCKFTSLPASMLNLPAASSINFEYNELVSIPNFASHVNKANLTLRLTYNRLDFSQLEPLVGAGIYSLAYAPQSPIRDVTTATLQEAADFTLTARAKGSFTSNIKWEKQQSNATWQDISSSNVDPLTGTTYRIANATMAAEGKYRWSCTSTSAVSMTLQSDPIEVKTPTRFALDNLAFQYKYDARKRMIAKRVPGADWVYMVYDKRDRLVLTQDGEQRKTNKWGFTKYDALNRPIMSGIYTHSTFVDQTGMSALISATNFFETYNGVSSTHGYTNTVFAAPNFIVANFDVHTVTYYDNYDFKSLISDPVYDFKSDELGNQYTSEVSGVGFNRVVGQVTGQKTRILGNKSWYLFSVNYYDDKGRIVQNVSGNYKSGIDRVTSVYDFVGKVLFTKNSHIAQDLTWQDTYGLRNDGSMLLSTVAGWSNLASSTEVLQGNSDGWIEMTVAELTNYKWLGLDPQRSPGYAQLDYAIYIYGGFRVYENGAWISQVTTTLSPGDKVRIERTNGTIYYKKNGQIIYTSANLSSGSLITSVQAYNPGAVYENLGASFCKNEQTTTRTFDYDHAGRLLKTFHSLNGATPVLLAQNEYNELGQLVDKKLYSTDPITTPDDQRQYKQSIDYRYNIRGWLTSINNSQLANDPLTNDDAGDLFGMELGYNNSLSGLSNTALFNGNISAMKWSSNQGLGSPAFGIPTERAYNFTYDPLNRLKSASHLDNNGSWAASTSFSEDNLDYDYNGNIKTLSRRGQSGSVMDILSYDYGTENDFSNQLRKVSDTSDKTKGFVDGSNIDNDYVYDSNGNMTIDRNKGIITSTGIAGITYNYLNLPEKVTKVTGDYIKYSYDATGRKLSQQVYNVSNVLKKKTDYVGEYFYENDSLKFINHEEGRILTQKSETGNNLISNAECNSLTNIEGAGGTVTRTNETINGETYVKIVAQQTTSTPGMLHAYTTVTPGAQYVFRMQAFRESTSAAYLYVMTGSANIVWPGPVIPYGMSSESWIEVRFAVPLGVTQIKVGALYNGQTIGDAFYVNKLELYQLKDDYTYQYNLKDHLGNVRLTFTTKHEADTSQAKLEPANAATEQSQFIYYNEAVKINSPLFDHTNNGSTNYSTRLTGGNTNEKYGLAKSLSVMPGDTLNIEVYAKYLDTEPNNWTTALENFIASIQPGGGAPAGTFVDGGAAGSIGSQTFPYLGTLIRENDNGTGPKGYLNYILFDRNFVYKTGGFKRISSAPRETGTDVAHERLAFDNLVITEPGYIYIYLSNENETSVEVFFDDFEVEHIKSPVIQTDDYYPFGLTFNSYSRENSVKNNYLNNGKEKQDELDLGWLDFGARMYQPEIGRWGAIDYLSEKFNSHSPYNYVLNNPTALVDPDGNDVYLMIWFTASGEIGHVGIATDNYKKEEVKDKDGNVVKDENGNAVTREVADGTVTYYDFYGEGAGVGTHNKDVTGNIRKQVMDKDEMYNSDFGTGNGSANGIVQLNASPNMTQHIAHEKEKMYQEQEKGNPTTYNGEKFNCSDFAKVGLNQIPGFYRVNGSENINIPPTRYNAEPYNKNITTPNFLFRSAKGIIQAGPAKGSVLKETGNPNKDYVNAYSGGRVQDKTPNQ